MDTQVLFFTFGKGMSGFFKFYIVLLTLRVYLTWFPNINFYTQPFDLLGRLTDPFLRAFRGFLPPFLGFDLSPLIGFSLITVLIDVCGKVSGET